jgi:hypothetical protein
MSQVRFGTNKDIKQYIRRALKQGWAVDCNGDQHIRVTPTSADPFTIPMTFGSQERVRRAKAQFKRAGLFNAR